MMIAARGWRVSQRTVSTCVGLRLSSFSVSTSTKCPTTGTPAGVVAAGSSRLRIVKRAGKLDTELERLGRTPLLIIDEVGYIPFDPDAAALLFALISSRYERASMIVSSNKTFSAWTEIFGDAAAVAALVDRLVHHTEVLVLRGDSYRLRDKSKDVLGTDPS